MHPGELEEYAWRLIEAMLRGHSSAFVDFARLVALLLPDFRKGVLSESEADRLVKNAISRILLAASRLTSRPASLLHWIERHIRQERKQWANWIGYDRKIGAELQKCLLAPQSLSADGLQAAFAMRPFDRVSGDICDLLLGRRDVLLVLGDVAGKGTAAAILGAHVLGLMRTLAKHVRHPARLLEALNRRLLERGPGISHMTMVVARWEPAARCMRFANAGHVLPKLFRNGTLTEAADSDTSLGWFPDVRYQHWSLAAEPGDVYLMLSDGLTEQPGSDPAGYEARLETVLKSCHHCSCQGILDAIWKDFDGFVGSNAHADDQTLIVVKIG